MPIARIHARTDELRSVLVCIDSYENKQFSGRIVYGQPQQECAFPNLMHFLLDMDELMENLDVPPSAMEKRVFAKPDMSAASLNPKDSYLTGTESSVGKIATFKIRILFRQNASWQGSVSWIEGNTESTFRSALELIMLMDSAMEE